LKFVILNITLFATRQQLAVC